MFYVLFVIYSQLPENIERLREALRMYSWNRLINYVTCGIIDVNTAFGDFTPLLSGT